MRKTILLSFFLIGLFSCEELLEVSDISDAQVTLLAPSDQSIVTQENVSFSWDGVAEAESYLVQIAQPNFSNATQLVLDSVIVIDSSFVGTRVSKILSNNSYEWRVKALNSDFETEFTQSGFEVNTTSN